MTTTNTLEDLVNQISFHNKLYWTDGEPEITDVEYDELVRQLEVIDEDHPLIHAVHAPQVAGSGKVVHANPMLSLDKAYSLEEILEWANKNARDMDEVFQIQPKYDGISANYAGGILATRGDGAEGENITDKLSLIELESTGYRGPVNRPVRGEIIIRNDDFENLYSNITRKDGKSYKNSRNAVAGIMGLKDIADIKSQGAKITIVDYDMISYTVTLRDFADQWASIITDIENLPYPMDGIVIKYADKAYADSLGNTAHHPRAQIAFKFTNVQRESVLLGVEWSFGKNCITPVAQIAPVNVSGVTIQRATLHNAQNIIDRDIHIGDTVIVERAGDVIPYIVSSTPGEDRQPALITHCPCCETELERRGPELCCVNADCSETLLQRLLAAVKNIGIDRLGEPNVRKMMDTLQVRTLKDIFNLTVESILTLEGFKDKSATNLFNEIQTAKNVNDYQLIAALNIPTVGKNVAKAVLKEYTIAELRELDEDKLAELNGVGPERARAIENELLAQSFFLDELLGCVNLIESKGSESDVKPTICFTGKMPEKRSVYEAMANERGYDAVSAITSSLSILVALDPNGGSSKLKKASKAGVTIMGLDDWLNSKKEPKNESFEPAIEKIVKTPELTTKPETPEPPEPPENDGTQEDSSLQIKEEQPAKAGDDDPFGSMNQGSFNF